MQYEVRIGCLLGGLGAWSPPPPQVSSENEDPKLGTPGPHFHMKLGLQFPKFLETLGSPISYDVRDPSMKFV